MSRKSGGADPQLHSRDRFAKLPDGLLLEIFALVGRISKRDLCSVSRLNKAYHGLADSILYKSIQFESPEHHMIFSESLSRRPRRGSAIQDVRLEYPSSELSHLILDAPVHGSHYAPARFDGLSRTISIMSNLETLDISVPATLLHGIGTLFNGPFDLACLKHCVLFYQCENEAYWDLQENIHIFAHPTLETLIIRRAKLDDRGFQSIERPHQTALKKLHLIDCDINDDTLSDVLEFPEGLREFIMTQTEEPVPELEESSDNIGHYICALKSNSHSLETITIDFPSLVGYRALRMREFVALKSLRLNWDYQLFGKSSKKPRLHSVGIPPELETLEFLNELGSDEEVTELFMNTIQMLSIVASKLKTIVVIEGGREIDEELIKACRAQSVQLDIIGSLDSD